MSRQSPDRRPSCGKSSIGDLTLFLGGCSGAARLPSTASSVSSSYKIYRNVTQVPALDGAHSASLPYARPNVPQPNCGEYFEYTCGDGSNGNFFCNQPTVAEVDINPTAIRVKNGAYYNSYVATNESRSLTAPYCNEVIGFKNVYAKVPWQGRFGYTSQHWGLPHTIEFCCNCQFHPADAGSDNTKYCGITGTATFEQTTGDNTITSNASSTSEIDPISGEYVVASCSSGSTGAFDDDQAAFLASQAFGMLSLGNGTVSTILTAWCNDIILYGTGSLTGGANSSFTNTIYNPSTGLADVVFSINIAAGTYSKDTYGILDVDRIQISHEEFTFTNTSVVYDHWIHPHTTNDNDTQTYHVECSLYNPSYAEDANPRLIALLDYWKLGDDERLPFRTDDQITQGPLVSYNATNNNLTLGLCSLNTTSLFDGSIKGKPLPLGYDPFWIAEHDNMSVCTDHGEEDCSVKYSNTLGSFPPSYIPYATQFLTENERTQVPQGAFMAGNFFWTTPSTCASTSEFRIQDDTLWACKYVEVAIPKPSFNFAEPCGPSRLQIVKDSNRCVSSATAGTLTLEATGQPTTLNSGDNAWVFGLGTAYDGVWTVTKNSDFSIGLTTQVASASQFDQLPFSDGGSGMIGKLRSGVPGICGRVDITSMTSTNPVTCSLMESAYLFPNDWVQVDGALGMPNGAFQITKVLNSQSIILPIDGTGKHYSGSGTLRFPFAADYRWNDVAPKGDYLVRKWDLNFRDVGEYQRLLAAAAFVSGESGCVSGTLCVPPSVPAPVRIYQSGCGLTDGVYSVTCETSCSAYNGCKPHKVVYMSPNDESLLESKYNAKNHGFGTATLDSEYQTGWHGLIFQNMDDPAWQAPPCICGQKVIESDDGEGGSMIDPTSAYTCNNCTLTEDDGTCHEDVAADPFFGTTCQKYFAERPQVEARCSIPDGAPTTYADKFGCLTVAQLNAGPVCPDGVVCDYPQNFGKFHFPFKAEITFTPYHLIYLAKQGCICADGRFADEYKKQLISCIEEEI